MITSTFFALAAVNFAYGNLIVGSCLMVLATMNMVANSFDNGEDDE